MVSVVLILGFYQKRISKICFYVSLLVLLILSAFRSLSMGLTDSIVYKDYFDACYNISYFSFNDFSNFKILYILLNSLIKTFTADFLCFQIIYNCICFIILIYLFNSLKLSNREKCALLFVYLCYRFIWNEWVVLRQNIAVLIFWLMFIRFWKNLNNCCERFVRYCDIVILIFIPYLFHSSGIVNIALIPVLLLLSKLNDKERIFITLTASIFIFCTSSFFDKFIIGVLMESVDERYSMYLNRDSEAINAISLIFKIVTYIIYYYILSYCKDINNCKERNTRLFISCLTSVYIILSSFNNSLIMRMSEYYAIGFYLMMVFVITHSFRYGLCGKLIRGGYFFGLMIILFHFCLVTDGGIYMEYSFYEH